MTPGGGGGVTSSSGISSLSDDEELLLELLPEVELLPEEPLLELPEEVVELDPVALATALEIAAVVELFAPPAAPDKPLKSGAS
jgi:hypothetical protein